MSIFSVVCWLVFGVIVGWVAKKLHPGEENISGWGTVALGVVGSFVGGAVNWGLGWGGFMKPSGFVMSIIGAVICCYAYTKYQESVKK